MKNTIQLWFFISSGVIFLYANSANSASLTTELDLSFGTFAVINNTTTSDIRITMAGSTIPTNHIAILNPGHIGEYTLHDDFAFTEIFTTVNIVSSETTSSLPSSAQLTLVAVETEFSVTTDASGDATIIVGGTLRTSGDGATYTNTTYSAVINFDISY